MDTGCVGVHPTIMRPTNSCAGVPHAMLHSGAQWAGFLSHLGFCSCVALGPVPTHPFPFSVSILL